MNVIQSNCLRGALTLQRGYFVMWLNACHGQIPVKLRGMWIWVAIVCVGRN